MSPEVDVAASGDDPGDVAVELWLGKASEAIDASLLAPDERDRLAKIVNPVAAQTYCSARTLLRRLLAARLGAAPEEVCFCYGPQGKPALLPAQDSAGLRFNLSHSGSMFAIALAEGSDVGVDIELVCANQNFDQLAGAMLCPAEGKIWATLTERLKARWFYWAWTRKEAVLKLTGEGLSRDPRGVDILADASSGAWALASRQIGAATLALATFRPAKLEVQVAWPAAGSDAA